MANLSNINNKFLVTTGGNVGIGATGPTAKLHIGVSSANDDTFHIFNGSVRTHLLGSESSNGVIYLRSSANSNKVRINTSGDSYFNGGNVGIGTTSPYAFDTTATKLHVKNDSAGSGNVGEVARFEGSSDADGSGGTIRLGTSNDRGIYFEGGRTGSVPYGIIGTTEYNGAKTYSIYLQNTGNVGIGTTSPNAKLEINSSITFSTIDTFGQLVVKAASGSTGDMLNIGVDTANSVAFIQAVERGVNTIPLSLQRYGGNVGIGTNSPAYNLQLASASSTTISVIADAATSASVYFGDSASTTQGRISYNNANDSFLFFTNATEKMRIDSSGEVLVGVTSNQTESKLTSRQNGSSIEFGHLNQSSGYYGTLGAMYSSGRPFLAFSCDSSPTSAGNNFATRGFKGNVIFSETNGNLKFAQATNANSTSQALTDRMAIKNDGAVQFNAYDSTNKTGTPTYLLGTDASGNVVKTNTVPGSGAGPYLPLSAGSSYPLTGELHVDDRVIIENTTNLTTGVADSLLIKTLSSGTSITNGFGGGLSFYLENTVYSAVNEVGKIAVIETDTIAIDDKMVFSVKDNNILAERLTLTGQEAVFTGNVGIGTDSPTAKLQVAGTTTYNSDSAQTLRVCDAADVSKGIHIGFDTTVNAGIIQAGDFGVSYRDLSLNPNAGNVGIGTTSPDHILCIEDTEPTFRIFDTANTLNQEQTISFGTEPGNRTQAEISGINLNTGNAEGGLIFKTNSGASLTERMRIDGSGNVDLTSGGLLKGMSAIELKNNGSTDASATSPRLYSPASGTLAFSGNSSERMRIDSSGVVQIGITASQSQARLNVRENGSAIEFGHTNTSNYFYGTLGSFGSNGTPFISFSCMNEHNANTWTTQGLEGNIINGDSNGNLLFQQVTARNTTGQTPVERMRITDIGRVVIGGTTASANTLTLVGSAVELDIHNTSGKRWRFNADTSGNLKFEDKTGGTEAMRIASNGNVGIGTTTPASVLHIKDNTAGPTQLSIQSNDFTRAEEINFLNPSTSAISGQIKYYTNPTVEYMSFSTSNNSATVERMRITSGGEVLISAQSYSDAGNNISLNQGLVKIGSATTTSTVSMYFTNPNGVVGSVVTSGSNTQFNTSSDYRLKEDLQDFNGLDKVSKIPVYDFKWKTDESRSYGVMAHELQEVLPDAVVGKKDAEEMQGVDYSKIVPLLVKSIQELKAEIELLKSK